MSGCGCGCGCGQPLTTCAPAVRRVDVETILLCDVLADGTVAGVALVEPIYDTTTGNRVGTRTVDPTTGAAYTPQGTLRPCEPETCTASTSTQVLCDIAADGTVTAFVRAATYDCGGELLATLDRTLDGDAYSPTGTVGTCPSPCRSSNTEILCDSTPVPLDLSVTYLPFSEAPVDVPSANEFDVGPTVGQQLWDGQSVTFGPTNGRHDLSYAVGAVVVACTDCGEPDDMVRITATVNATLNGPTAGQSSTGGLELLNGNTGLAVSPFPRARGSAGPARAPSPPPSPCPTCRPGGSASGSVPRPTRPAPSPGHSPASPSPANWTPLDADSASFAPTSATASPARPPTSWTPPSTAPPTSPSER
ncbi:hypothetical protein Srufu_004080 [Streptomyces libani subsp. rufus]|nr:hypothetical protein Srufu_004080 [Streptomyces libani subsp. rufus]